MKLYAEKQINNDCKHLFENAEKSVIAVFNKNAATFNTASKVSLKLICKNLLVNFLVSIVLLAAATGGILFVQNYKDGTKIAEEKAIEVLAKEKETIGKDAINLYKKSSEFREDACKLVAENISTLDCMNHLYVYMKSESLKKYPQVKVFYNDFLKEGYKQYCSGK